MDSINKQQPEENRKNLTGPEAVTKVKELIEKAETCFFCTQAQFSGELSTRPMAVQKVDDEANCWLLSANDSHKNQQILVNPAVQLFFQGSAHSDFLAIKGHASIIYDKDIIKELWQPILKTWFTEGENDPRISIIKVTVNDGYYWDTKHSEAVAFVKQLVGAAIGKTLDDSIEGTLKV